MHQVIRQAVGDLPIHECSALGGACCPCNGPDGATHLLNELGQIRPAGEVQRAVIATDDSSWEWVQLVVRTPDIENRPLSELLEWVARETGRPMRYESPAVRALTQSTILHGSIRNLAPLPAAQTVLATTDLDLEILADGSLLLKGRNRGGQFR